MKSFKKIITICALVLTLGVSTTLLFACGEKDNVDKLSICQEFKTEYYVGDTLDVSNGILKYIDEENKEQYITLLATMVSSFSTETPGTRDMLIKYEEETILVSYTVKAYDVKDGIYYKTDSQSNGQNVYLIFDLEQNTLTQYNSYSTPAEKIDNGTTFDIEKSTNAQGFIEYSATIKNSDIKAKITDINKNSFKMTISTGELSYVATEYVQQ